MKKSKRFTIHIIHGRERKKRKEKKRKERGLKI
jgi:hypothetical protein